MGNPATSWCFQGVCRLQLGATSPCHSMAQFMSFLSLLFSSSSPPVPSSPTAMGSCSSIHAASKQLDQGTALQGTATRSALVSFDPDGKGQRVFLVLVCILARTVQKAMHPLLGGKSPSLHPQHHSKAPRNAIITIVHNSSFQSSHCSPKGFVLVDPIGLSLVIAAGALLWAVLCTLCPCATSKTSNPQTFTT